jgi:hypothetical protein
MIESGPQLGEIPFRLIEESGYDLSFRGSSMP